MEDARVGWRFPLRSLPAPLPVDEVRRDRSVTYRRTHLSEATAADGAILYTLAENDLS